MAGFLGVLILARDKSHDFRLPWHLDGFKLNQVMSAYKVIFSIALNSVKCNFSMLKQTDLI